MDSLPSSTASSSVQGEIEWEVNSDNPVDDESAVSKGEERIHNGFFARRAACIARRPWLHFWIALIIAVVLSVVGMVFGVFSVEADNAGWQTRGTLIANRETQALLLLYNRERLLYEGETAWEDLTNNAQPGWQADEYDDDAPSDRKLSRSEVVPQTPILFDATIPTFQSRSLPFSLDASMARFLEEDSLGGRLEGCDVSWYTSGHIMEESHLWPIWKTSEPTSSALDPNVIHDICVAEESTLASLQAEGLCYGCNDGRCLPPYSLVFFVRLSVGDTDFTMTCDELSSMWASYIDTMEMWLELCVSDVKETYRDGEPLPDSCPPGFSPAMLDELFDANNPTIRYTSSVFASSPDTESLYEKVSDFDRAEWSSLVEGAYDTQYEDFVGQMIDDSLLNDMILALGSAAITAFAILVHTRSPWLTLVGLVQIIISFPLAFFVYSLIAGLDFFPFLNFIGIFVVFALGADDIFVAVDKWKNARLEHKKATTEEIAAIALPDAAGAMFLTSLTTAVAFFGTAICKVAPLKMFAIFCGLLICFDYIMCVLLIFPALCIYDKSLVSGRRNRCISCQCFHRFNVDDDGDEEAKPSLIRRILLGYYKTTHCIRWPLLAGCMAALGISIYYATKLELPTTADVRMLDSSSSQYEQNFEWRSNLLSEVLGKAGGSQASVIWGIHPADTGNHNNPESWSQLVLDESFDPSTEAAQEYLGGFCDEFFANDFATRTDSNYICPMDSFNLWLQEEAGSSDPSPEYMSNCGGAWSLPVPQDTFHTCISAWSQLVNETAILHRNGQVKIILNQFQSRVRYDSPFDELDSEWNAIESWMTSQDAPTEVSGMFFSSSDFWWYDTNQNMLATAYGAAGIALAAAALVMMFSSRSLVLTIFAIVTIGFILASVTALLSAIGWTLGFLESVCFAIAIGISCDFVLHFSHAYASLPGKATRHERTKHALIHMGPSILAAAFTTIMSAVVMIFTVISFFQKFAMILFFTILMATIGAFVFFVTLADSVGPSQPTYLVDLIVAKCCSCCKKDEDDLESQTNDLSATETTRELSNGCSF